MINKTIICLIAIFTVFSFGCLTNADAYPFQKAEGSVNPDQVTIVDDGLETTFSSDDSLGASHSGMTTLVPEPGTLMLLGSGLAGLFYIRHKKVFNI